MEGARKQPASAPNANDELGGKKDYDVRFSELLEFPVFRTYAAFLRHLSAGLHQPFRGYVPGNEGREVDFNEFTIRYYPHFSSQLKVKLDVDGVYTEFVSVIKGSTAALKSPRGRLERGEYVALVESARSSEYDAATRHLIYDAFEKYEREKGSSLIATASDQRDQFDYDQGDAVYYIYSCLQAEGYNDVRFSNVYVDEVQDLTPAQIVLFKFVCNNDRGFVFAGDTAQTITNGVSFRFQTLKDLMWDCYFSDASTEEEKKALMPRFAQLRQNFRTHTGVLFLARSLVDCISNFFPNSIDKLERESSTVMGPKPWWITFEDGTDVIKDLFGDESSPMVDFGAEQAILVRDDSTKARIQKACPNTLILTVLEAKGMEFDDVLVLDFFDSSPMKSEWRVLYKLILSAHLSSELQDICGDDVKYPDFDSSRHGLLRNELKMLYVLASRAKNRLLFSDRSDAALPMLHYWLASRFVEQRPFDEDIKNLFNVKSSPEEWKKKGTEFFAKKQYANARHCFTKAGETDRVRLLAALETEEAGDKNAALAAAVSSDKNADRESKRQYLAAAEMFRSFFPLGSTSPEVGVGLLTAAEIEQSVSSCYVKALEFSAAAEFHQQLGQLELAGKWFLRAKMVERAADCYWDASLYVRALDCYGRLEMHRPALLKLEALAGEGGVSSLGPDLQALHRECAKKGAVISVSRGDSERVLFFVKRFTTVDDQRRFLRKNGLLHFLLPIELHAGNFSNAAEIYLEQFDAIGARDNFIKADKVEKGLISWLARFRRSVIDFTGKWLPEIDFALPPAIASDFKELMRFASTGGLPVKAESSGPSSSLVQIELALLTLLVDVNSTALSKTKSKKGKGSVAPAGPKATDVERAEALVTECLELPAETGLRLQLVALQLFFRLQSALYEATRDPRAFDRLLACSARFAAAVRLACETLGRCCEAHAFLVPQDLAVANQVLAFFEATAKGTGDLTAESNVTVCNLEAARKPELLGAIDVSLLKFPPIKMEIFRKAFSAYLVATSSRLAQSVDTVRFALVKDLEARLKIMEEISFSRLSNYRSFLTGAKQSVPPLTDERFAARQRLNELRPEKLSELRTGRPLPSVVDLVLPRYPQTEDMKQVAMLRGNPALLRMLSSFSASPFFMQPGLNFESICRILSVAEILDSVPKDASRLLQICQREERGRVQKTRGKMSARSDFVDAFLWGDSENVLGFERFICRCADSIHSEFYLEHINALLFRQSVHTFKSRETFSPSTFLALAESLVCWGLLLYNEGSAILPLKTLESCCLKPGKYVRAARKLHVNPALGDESKSNLVRAIKATLDVLLDTIGTLVRNDSLWEEWIKDSLPEGAPAVEDTASAILVQMIFLVRVILVNMRFRKFSERVNDLIKISLHKDRLPPCLRICRSSLIEKLVHMPLDYNHDKLFDNILLSTIVAGNILHNELVLLTASAVKGPLPRVTSMLKQHLRLEVAPGLDASGREFLRLVPLEASVPPPSAAAALLSIGVPRTILKRQTKKAQEVENFDAQPESGGLPGDAAAAVPGEEEGEEEKNPEEKEAEDPEEKELKALDGEASQPMGFALAPVVKTCPSERVQKALIRLACAARIRWAALPAVDKYRRSVEKEVRARSQGRSSAHDEVLAFFLAEVVPRAMMLTAHAQRLERFIEEKGAGQQGRDPKGKANQAAGNNKGEEKEEKMTELSAHELLFVIDGARDSLLAAQDLQRDVEDIKEALGQGQGQGQSKELLARMAATMTSITAALEEGADIMAGMGTS